MLGQFLVSAPFNCLLLLHNTLTSLKKSLRKHYPDELEPFMPFTATLLLRHNYKQPNCLIPLRIFPQGQADRGHNACASCPEGD